MAKSDASRGMERPQLIPMPVAPVPSEVLCPTSAPLAICACVPMLVPHITTQSVFGLT